MMEDEELYRFIKHYTKLHKNTMDDLENINKSSVAFGFVLEVSANKTSRNTYYGFGSVRLMVPNLAAMGVESIWALPLKGGFGNLEIPKIGSTVLVFTMGDVLNGIYTHYYMNSSTISSNPYIEFGSYPDYYNTEDIGFTYKPNNTYKGYIGGRYVKNVLENPGESKLISSTNTFVFYQSEKDEKVELKGADDYIMNLQVGDNGLINIGYSDETTDAVQTGSADLDVDLGIEGDAIIQTVEGNIDIKVKVSSSSTKGYIKLKAGSNSITISQDGIYIVGNTYISGTLMVSQEVHWKTVGFSPTGTPPYATATANRGSTHMHPTAVPGPPSPPTPGT